MNESQEINMAHAGSSFDDFLHEDGSYEEANAVATKRVIAWQLAEAMKTQGITKVEMAHRMKTSRSSLDRLLNPNNDSLALLTLQKAATVLGKQVRVELV